VEIVNLSIRHESRYRIQYYAPGNLMYSPLLADE